MARCWSSAGVNVRTLERIDPDARGTRGRGRGRATLLRIGLDEPLDDLAAVSLGGGRVGLLGGQRSRGGDTVDATWLLTLDDAGGELEAGPGLDIEGGVADARLLAIPPPGHEKDATGERQWLLLGGRVAAGGPGHGTQGRKAVAGSLAG